MEIVNEAMNVKCDDKLNNNLKFEQFYDYLSSELRSNGLLHVIHNKINSNVKDEKILEGRRLKSTHKF